MPCDSSQCEHTEREAESGRVREFLKEISQQPYDHEQPSYYGCVESLDADTAQLCEFMGRLHPQAVRSYSLELQLWWQRHQKHDAARARRRREIMEDTK